MKKTFTSKKIEENLSKVTGLNLAVVMPNGDLYIHCHGQMMRESVYKNREDFCDVTDYISDYINGEYSKRDTARMIRESAELFYEKDN